MAAKQHVNLKVVEEFLRRKIYLKEIGKDKGKKANFRRTCKNFSIKDGELFYKKSRKVIFDEQQKIEIVHDIHEGIGENARSKAMASHRGRESTYQKLSERFFWHGMVNDVKNYIKNCKNCQRQSNTFKKISPQLQSIPVPTDVMKQIGIDICNLPEVDGYRHLIVCIDYFSKWLEAKATKDKSAPTVAQFIYDIICRHGCVKTEQRVTSVYHPQSNGLSERQNRTIKDSLVKVLEEKPKEWPSIIEGILFAHRVSVHYSTKYSPLFLMYNRHPVLPIDIKYDLIDDTANNDSESDPFDIETFQAVLNSAASIREATHHQTSLNIEKATTKGLQ